MSTGLFENNATHKQFVYKSYISYVYKQDLALNNLQWLICHKIQPTNYLFLTQDWPPKSSRIKNRVNMHFCQTGLS